MSHEADDKNMAGKSAEFTLGKVGAGGDLFFLFSERRSLCLRPEPSVGLKKLTSCFQVKLHHHYLPMAKHLARARALPRSNNKSCPVPLFDSFSKI